MWDMKVANWSSLRLTLVIVFPFQQQWFAEIYSNDKKA